MRKVFYDSPLRCSKAIIIFFLGGKNILKNICVHFDPGQTSIDGSVSNILQSCGRGTNDQQFSFDLLGIDRPVDDVRSRDIEAAFVGLAFGNIRLAKMDPDLAMIVRGYFEFIASL